jgi:2-oxoglutarate dehydrogenase E1 component
MPAVAPRAACSTHPAGGAGDARERSVGQPDHRLRSRGHLAANLDPLGMAVKPEAPDLALGFHHLSEGDLGAEFSTGGWRASRA